MDSAGTAPTPLAAATEICTTLQQRGFVAYFAGGFVRDRLLGIESADIDIATSALPEEVMRLFPRHISVGAHFGVCLVLYRTHQFEVATFRSEGSYHDGRHPGEVHLRSTPEADAQRRDFTINGMFYDPLTSTIYDYVGGQEDLARKLIRTIGIPDERFAEDRLRMIRAVRFAFRFGFAIQEETREAIARHSQTLLPAVSMERIWQELCKIAGGPQPIDALTTMQELGLLSVIFPPLAGVAASTLRQRLALAVDVPPILLLAQLFDNPLGLHKQLHASNEDGKYLAAYIQLMAISDDAEPAQWAEAYADPHTAPCFAIRAARLPPDKRSSWLSYHARQQELLQPLIANPPVRADDLKARGIAPGPHMGQLLRAAQRIALNEQLNDKEAILQRLDIVRSQ